MNGVLAAALVVLLLLVALTTAAGLLDALGAHLDVIDALGGPR